MGPFFEAALYLYTVLHLSLWDWTRGVTEEVCLLHEIMKRFPAGIPERLIFPRTGVSVLSRFELLHRRGLKGEDALGGDFALRVVCRRAGSQVRDKYAFIQLKIARGGEVKLSSSQIKNAQPVIDHSFVMAASRLSRSIAVTATQPISVSPGVDTFGVPVDGKWLPAFEWAHEWLSCNIGSGNPNASDGRPLADILIVERRPIEVQERALSDDDAGPDALGKLGINARALWSLEMDMPE
jgi:hypothetical protein